MAGYTRQSIADIINGSEVTAPPLNAEFNQMAAAFAAASGHSHDGSTGNAPKIDLTTSVAGYLPAVHGGTGGKSNNTATTNPTATDDASEGYAPMSMWENTTTGRVFICVGNTNNAAVWRELVQVQTGNKIIPEATNTVDLGEPSTRFQDLWLSGGLSAFGNASMGGTLSVTGAATFSSLSTSGIATLASSIISGGTIDNNVIGGTTPQAVTGTLVTATTGFAGYLTGDVVGNVTGDLTGDVTGDVTGNITGNVTGNVTASTGTTTLNDLVVNGTADFTNTTLVNIVDPTAPQHAATKNYVDTADALKLDLAGGTMSGDITMGSNKVTGLPTPTLSADAATKGYVDAEVSALVDSAPGTLDTLNELAAALGDDADFSTTVTNSIATKLPLSGGTMTGDIVLGTNAVTTTADPATGNELARKSYIDTADALKLNLTGGTMSGAIAMGTSKITGMGDPTLAQDAATKTYVDTADALKLDLAGGTMTGTLAMGANKVTSTATPTADDDLTRKGYIDTLYGSTASAAASAAAAATSATNSAASATNSATSAASSLTSENNSSTSETNAATSAAAAATSAANALTSETNASTSETNAAASAAIAEDAAIVFAIALG